MVTKQGKIYFKYSWMNDKNSYRISKYIYSFQLTFDEFCMVHLETAVFVIGHLQH